MEDLSLVDYTLYAEDEENMQDTTITGAEKFVEAAEKFLNQEAVEKLPVIGIVCGYGDNVRFGWLTGIGFTVLPDRFGRTRLYYVVKNSERLNEKGWSCVYVAKLESGEFSFAFVDDEEEARKARQNLNYFDAEMGKREQAAIKKEEKKGGNLALKIIFFPFWLLGQFVKAVWSVVKIMFH